MGLHPREAIRILLHGVAVAAVRARGQRQNSAQHGTRKEQRRLRVRRGTRPDRARGLERKCELALVSGPEAVRSATVAALEQSETHAIYRPEFDALRHEHPRVGDVLVALLADAVRRTNELLLDAYYAPAELRVLRRLRDAAAAYPDGEVRLTQEDLASLAGTSRATVNRVLRDAERRGALELSRGRTVVRDPDELARRAR